MFAIINEELMSFSVQETVDEKNENKIYFKLNVNTTDRLVQPESVVTNRHRRGKKNTSTNNETAEMICGRKNNNYRAVNMNDKLIPVNREVAKISAQKKDLLDLMEKSETPDVELKWTDVPMSIHIANGQHPYDTQVDIRCHQRGEDHSNLYIIAFPFNGLIKPIKPDKRYRIYKGFIATSAKPIFFGSHKYRKILYLVLEINKNLFDPNRKKNTDCIDIEFESFALFDDKVDGIKKTNHEKMILNITSPNGEYTTDWSYELINDAIYMNVNPGEELWPIYKFGSDDNNKEFHLKYKNQNKRGMNQKKNFSHNQAQMQKPAPKGYTVSVNKHGIRKETSNRRFTERPYPYEDDYETNNNRNNGKKRGNPRHNKKNKR